jgi:hypothetical protein
VLWYALLTPSQVSKFIELVGHDFCEYFWLPWWTIRKH